jgi:hypothetical protein
MGGNINVSLRSLELERRIATKKILFPLSSFFRYIMMGDGQEVKNFLTCYDNTEKEV